MAGGGRVADLGCLAPGFEAELGGGQLGVDTYSALEQPRVDELPEPAHRGGQTCRGKRGVDLVEDAWILQTGGVGQVQRAQFGMQAPYEEIYLGHLALAVVAEIGRTLSLVERDTGVMAAEAERLADALLSGAHSETLAACDGSPGLAADVSARVCELLVDRVVNWSDPRWPPKRIWADDQAGVVALSRLAGADARGLAVALSRACDEQKPVPVRVNAGEKYNLLADETFAWLMQWAPDVVGEVIDGLGSGRFGPGFMHDHLWWLPGREGARWLVRIVRARNEASLWAQVPAMERVWHRAWSVEDWLARLDALIEADFSPAPKNFSLPRVPNHPPRETAAAQVQLACRYGQSRDDFLLRTVAANLKAYRSGDPETDCQLVWWQPTGSHRDVLNWIIDLSGDHEANGALIHAARNQDLVSADLARLLIARPERPPWATQGIAWTIEKVIDVGVLSLPDGQLCACDPYSLEPASTVLDLVPGTYPVRIVTATNPDAPAECAAAEIVLDDHAAVTTWSPFTVGENTGYVATMSTGAFGAPQALAAADVPELCERSIPSYHRSWCQIDLGGLGSVVAFTVGPPRQTCRTWIGSTAAGHSARIVTDLGLLNLDPPNTPQLPW
jgi:hypothetical protein